MVLTETVVRLAVQVRPLAALGKGEKSCGAGGQAGSRRGLVVKAPGLVVLVRCLHCHHRSTLSPQALAAFGIKPNVPIAAFVKRLRCTECGSGSVMANRVAANEAVARRLHA